MKITFEGESFSEIRKQMNSVLANVQANTQHSSQQPTEPPTAAPSLTTEKRKPGRPSKKVEAPSLHIAPPADPTPITGGLSLNDDFGPTGEQPAEMVGAAGVEPAVTKTSLQPQQDKTTQAATTQTNVPQTKISKELLTQALQSLCEKADSAAGNKMAGISKVRSIFEKFGVKRLGELDEKRYHELLNVVNHELAAH